MLCNKLDLKSIFFINHKLFQVMVFAGSCNGRIFGKLFIRGTMNSAIYQHHVKELCIPELKAGNNVTLAGTIS